MVKIAYTGQFKRDLKLLLLDGNKDLREEINSTIDLFQKNPEDTRLGMHELRKRLEGKWAIVIVGDETGDLRITFEWLGKNLARFLRIGPHPVAYGKQI